MGTGPGLWESGRAPRRLWPPSRRESVSRREWCKGPGAEGSREFPGAEQSVRPESTRSFLKTESVPRDILRKRSLAPEAKHRAGSRKGQSDYYLRRDSPGCVTSGDGVSVLRPHSARSEPSAGHSRRLCLLGVLGDQLAACLDLRVFSGRGICRGPSWAKGMLVPFAGRRQVAAPALGLMSC